MNRIDHCFQSEKKNLLSIYVTAGFPELNDTVRMLEYIQEAGADMVELGMPFSDPLADGPVIQQSSEVALENGMSLSTLFKQLEGMRDRVSLPIILMGYLNPVLQYGMERFLQDCSKVDIDGVILPDLPLAQFEKHYKRLFEEADIRFSMLITPQTQEERIRQIDLASSGFLYMVADSATTGAKGAVSDAQLAYFSRINGMQLTLPRMIGFGISDNSTFRVACDHARGAIIGSAFIRAIQEHKGKDLQRTVIEFIDKIIT